MNHRFFDFIRTDIRCSHLTLDNLGQKQDVRFTRAVVSMPAVEPENRRIETRFIPESSAVQLIGQRFCYTINGINEKKAYG